MAFYKFSWTKDGSTIENNINPTRISTRKITEFVKPDIKEENDKKDEINEEVLLLAVKHFIDTSFKKDNDMNKMGFDRSEETGGEIAYNHTGIIVDIVTNNYMDIQNQRFREHPSIGIEKTIPLSFYFDVSGSMYEHTDFLSRLAFLLLKNGISIIMGYNEFVNGTILASDGVKSIDELKKVLEKDNYYNHFSKGENRNLDIFLKEKKAEKCVIFSDFDPYKAICDLSKHCKVYWFCFEERYNSPRYDFKSYKGNVYYTDSFDSMKSHFINMDNYDYVEKQKKLILDITYRRKKKNGKN